MEITNKHIVLATLLVLVCIFMITAQAPKTSAAGPFVTNIGATATTSVNTAITTSARIAATTTNPLDPTNSYTRVYAEICTTSASPVALNLDGDKRIDASASAPTAWIAAAAGYNACYEIRDYNTYNGSIQASSTVAATVSVKQYVQ